MELFGGSVFGVFDLVVTGVTISGNDVSGCGGSRVLSTLVGLLEEMRLVWIVAKSVVVLWTLCHHGFSDESAGCHLVDGSDGISDVSKTC